MVTRTRELEAALDEASSEAQRLAAEAVQLDALLGFYIPEQPPAPRLSSEGVAGVPAAGSTGERQPPHGSATTPVRRAPAPWTSGWRDAATAALRDHGGPLHYRDLYRIVAARGFTFGGKSPEATFLASLHRDRATFQGAGKGTYWLVESDGAADPTPAPRTRRRTSRPRPIGRRKSGA